MSDRKGKSRDSLAMASRQGCQPLGTKNASSLVKNAPNGFFFYVRASEKCPIHKNGAFFPSFIAFLLILTKENSPCLEKMPFFPKKALKMPTWQPCNLLLILSRDGKELNSVSNSRTHRHTSKTGFFSLIGSSSHTLLIPQWDIHMFFPWQGIPMLLLL